MTLDHGGPLTSEYTNEMYEHKTRINIIIHTILRKEEKGVKY